MEIKPYRGPDGQGVTVKFDENEMPIISDMLRPYCANHGETMERAAWLGYAVYSLLARVDKAREANEIPKATSINLGPEHYPIFIREMKLAANEYEDELLDFRQVLTPLSLGLLRADIPGESPSSGNPNDSVDVYHESLVEFDKKLESVDNLAVRFEFFDNLLKGQ